MVNLFGEYFKMIKNEKRKYLDFLYFFFKIKLYIEIVRMV